VACQSPSRTAALSSHSQARIPLVPRQGGPCGAASGAPRAGLWPSEAPPGTPAPDQPPGRRTDWLTGSQHGVAGSRLPRLSLSSSRHPRLCRPSGVARDRLRRTQTRPPLTRGIRACEKTANSSNPMLSRASVARVLRRRAGCAHIRVASPMAVSSFRVHAGNRSASSPLSETRAELAI
jgi:hypothetical protein